MDWYYYVLGFAPPLFSLVFWEEFLHVSHGASKINAFELLSLYFKRVFFSIIFLWLAVVFNHFKQETITS